MSEAVMNPFDEAVAETSEAVDILNDDNNNYFHDDNYDNNDVRKSTFVDTEFTRRPSEFADVSSSAAAATTVSSSSSSSSSSSGDGMKYHPRHVTVGEPEKRGGRWTSFVVYKVAADPAVLEPVFRRFSDFVWVRESLQRLFPCLFIPALPAKKLLGSDDEATVHERQSDLERFLNRLVKRPCCVDSDPFQLFLYKTTAFEDAQKEFSKKIEKRDTEDYVNAYKQIYPHLSSISLPSNIDTEMDSLREFLTNSERRMETLLSASEKLSASVNSFISDIGRLNLALNANYDVEKAFSERPLPARLDVSEHFISWHLAEKEFGTAHELFLIHTFKHELQDLQAYIEILKVRYEVQSKYVSCVKTAKSWEGKAVKNEKQEASKQQDLAREQLEKEHLDVVNKLIYSLQLQPYWKARVASFKQQIGSLANQQSSTVQRLNDTWEGLASLVKLDPVDGDADPTY